jgi:hypothetical protein
VEHKKGFTLNEQEIDKEIAELDQKLKGLQALQKRRAELVNIKSMVYRVWLGSSKEPSSNGHKELPKGRAGRRTTTAGLIFEILAGHGPLKTAEILEAARLSGYVGSGNDQKDKKRLLAAMYGAQDKFERDGDKWGVRN